jgi:hypothetical protein
MEVFCLYKIYGIKHIFFRRKKPLTLPVKGHQKLLVVCLRAVVLPSELLAPGL